MDESSFFFFLGFLLGGVIIGMVVYFNTKREFEQGNELMCDAPDPKMSRRFVNEAEKAAIRAERLAKCRRCRERKCREYVVPKEYTKFIMKDPVPTSPKEEPKEE